MKKSIFMSIFIVFMLMFNIVNADELVLDVNFEMEESLYVENSCGVVNYDFTSDGYLSIDKIENCNIINEIGEDVVDYDDRNTIIYISGLGNSVLQADKEYYVVFDIETSSEFFNMSVRILPYINELLTVESKIFTLDSFNYDDHYLIMKMGIGSMLLNDNLTVKSLEVYEVNDVDDKKIKSLKKKIKSLKKKISSLEKKISSLNEKLYESIKLN